MNKNQRLTSFISLGRELKRFISSPDDHILSEIQKENPWFIREFVIDSLTGISILLDVELMNAWLKNYDLTPTPGKAVGIVMPGNIPLAGFHDLMCVLLSGNNAIIKPSHSDRILTRFIVEKLFQINDEFRKMIVMDGNFNDADAIIATGSDNTSRYFRYYFSNKPCIIRRNRTSCAILNGNENKEDLKLLADDVFMYFGLGCRNVSKIFIPADYLVTDLELHFSPYNRLKNHNKYCNNYLYQKALAGLSGERIYDMKFFHFKENKGIMSPLSVIYYENYKTEYELDSFLQKYSDKIQCIVTGNQQNTHRVDFGQAQYPKPGDYADGVDTLEFLECLGVSD
jgi:hypothetical protein